MKIEALYKKLFQLNKEKFAFRVGKMGSENYDLVKDGDKAILFCHYFKWLLQKLSKILFKNISYWLRRNIFIIKN